LQLPNGVQSIVGDTVGNAAVVVSVNFPMIESEMTYVHLRAESVQAVACSVWLTAVSIRS
jgi:hypothetical protein